MRKLKSLANPQTRAGMSQFGIPTQHALGISIPVLRKLASETGKDHELAGRLWESAIHEARILAAFVDDACKVSETQMERWAADFDSWDICDACCGNLFDRTPFAYEKAREWSRRPEEFVKRAGFALMATLAVHDKLAADSAFHAFLPNIWDECNDSRNFVKKAVNWALRQIGKRNLRLNRAAIRAAKQIRDVNFPAARWIASNALRELTSDAVQRRLKKIAVARASQQRKPSGRRRKQRR